MAKAVIRHGAVTMFNDDMDTQRDWVYWAEVDSGFWYVAHGSDLVNLAHAEPLNGGYLMEIVDYDCFTLSQPCTSLLTLVKEVEDRETNYVKGGAS